MTLSEFMDYLSMVETPDSPVKFDMNRTAEGRRSTLRGCGSACCIGGHAALLLGRHLDEPATALALLLSIRNHDAEAICWPNVTEEINPYAATLAQALRLLEHYSRTGEVDWPLAMGAV